MASENRRKDGGKAHLVPGAVKVLRSRPVVAMTLFGKRGNLDVLQ